MRTWVGVKRRENFRRTDRPSPSEEANPAKRRQSDRTTDDAVPPVLPVVVAEAHGDDLVVRVGDAKDAAETVPRAELGATLARLVADLGVPTRVELHEADGRVLVDILDPPRETEVDTPEDGTPSGGSEDEAELVEVAGKDFMAGEAVAVAAIMRHTSADGDGQARALVNPALVPGAGGAEVVMVGRISGVVVVRSLT